MIKKMKFDHPRKVAGASVLVGSAADVAVAVRQMFDEDDELAEAMDALPSDTPVAFLDHIWARTKGRGAGSRMLGTVLEAMDSEGVAVTFLWSAPDEETDPARLESWYVAHGFERVEADPDALRETVPMQRRYLGR